jgi:hypothetical protein
MGQNADELRRDIERTRMEMSDNLDAIGDRVSPRRMAERRWQRTRNWFGSARDSVFGAPERRSPYGYGYGYGSGYGYGASAPYGTIGYSGYGDRNGPAGEGSLRDTVSDKAHQAAGAVQDMAESVQQAPQAIAGQARGNPMVAGAIAFGIGLLGSMVFGPTDTERQAFDQLSDQLEPVKQGLTQSAREVASSVQQEGREAVEDLKDQASEHASTVADTAKDAAQHAKDAT